MAAVRLMLTMLVLLMATLSSGITPEDKATDEIVSRLYGGYKKTLRPSSSDTTEVELQVYFRNIAIDEVTMTANVDITFRMLWNDDRLKYDDMQGVSNVQYISLLDPSPLWLPDPFFKNGKVSQYKSIHPELYLRIFPNGDIIYSTRVSLQQSCPMNLRRFPHDTQVCDIKVASYGYTTKDVRFKLATDKAVQFGQDIHADRFHFEDYFIDVCNSNTSTGSYSCVQVSMKLRRQFATYLLEWYVPCMFLVIVAWYSFLVSGEQFLGRVLLTLVPLITLTTFSNEHKKSMASVPYGTAMDTFTGISVTIIFLTLLYVILTNVRASKEGKEKAGSTPEDGEVKTTEVEQGWVRRFALRIRQRADYFTRVFLIGAYVFFLFVYFVAYCGTG